MKEGSHNYLSNLRKKGNAAYNCYHKMNVQYPSPTHKALISTTENSDWYKDSTGALTHLTPHAENLTLFHIKGWIMSKSRMILLFPLLILGKVFSKHLITTFNYNIFFMFRNYHIIYSQFPSSKLITMQMFPLKSMGTRSGTIPPTNFSFKAHVIRIFTSFPLRSLL